MKIAIMLLMFAASGPQPDTLRVSLLEAVEMAREGNQTLQAHEARAQMKAQLPLQASPAFLPSVSVGMQGMRTRWACSA